MGTTHEGFTDLGGSDGVALIGLLPDEGTGADIGQSVGREPVKVLSNISCADSEYSASSAVTGTAGGNGNQFSPLHSPNSSYSISSFTTKNATRKVKKRASAKSLSSFAMKKHLQQDNRYMTTEEVSASVILQLHKLSNSTNNSSWNSGASGRLGGSGSDQNLLNAIAEYEALGVDSPQVKEIKGAGAGAGEVDPLSSFTSRGVGSSKNNRHANLVNSYLEQKSEKRRNEKEKTEIQDDADWIPVSDDEEETPLREGSTSFGFMRAASTDSSLPASTEVSLRIPASVPENSLEVGGNTTGSGGNAQLHISISAAIPNPTANNLQSRHALQSNQSYMFTKSGTMLVDGLGAAIGKTGMHSKGKATRSAHLTPGSGGSGSVSGGGGSGSNLHLQLPMKERLVVLCRLGNGASGIVYKALDLISLRFVALKIVPVFERAKRKQMTRELTTLFHMLRHVNSSAVNDPLSLTAYRDQSKYPYEFIVSFFDAFSVIDEGGVALMMEYMDGGSLQDIVDIGGCDDEETLGSIALQAVLGLKFLHDCKQIHRDLKPGNLLINKRGDVKVADLGILKQLDEAEEVKTGGGAAVAINKNDENGITQIERPNLQRTNTFVGTATYMSPERIDGKDYSYPSDIWALGLAILAVATGKMPIQASGGYWSVLQAIRDDPSPVLPVNTVDNLEDKIAAQLSIDPTVTSPVFWSDEFRDFITSCLKKNPDERLSCNDLLQHPFLQKASALQAEQGRAPELDGELYFDEEGVKHFHPVSTTAAAAEDIPAPPVSDAPADDDSDDGIDPVYREHVEKGLGEVKAIISALYEHLLKLCRDILTEYKEEQQGRVQLARVAEEAGSEPSSPVDAKQNATLPNKIVVAPKMPFKMAPLQLPGMADSSEAPANDAGAENTPVAAVTSEPLPNKIVVAPKMPFKMAPLQLPGMAGDDASTSSDIVADAAQALHKPHPAQSPIPVGSSGGLSSATAAAASSAHVCVFDRAAVCAKWHAHYRETHFASDDIVSNYFLSTELEEEVMLRNDLVSTIRCVLLGTRGLTQNPSGSNIFPMSEGQGGRESSAVVSSLMHPSLHGALATPPPVTIVGPPGTDASAVKKLQSPGVESGHLERVFALSKQLYLPVDVIVRHVQELCDGMVVVPGASASSISDAGGSTAVSERGGGTAIPLGSFMHSTPKAYHSSGKHT